MRALAIASLLLFAGVCFGQVVPAGQSVQYSDLASHLEQLSSSNTSVRLSALRYWGANSKAAVEVVYEHIYLADEPDYETADRFASDLASAVGRCVDSKNRSIRGEAIRTLCSMTEFPGGCGTGWNSTLGGQSFGALMKRADAIRGDLRGLVTDADPHIVDVALSIDGHYEKDPYRFQPEVRAMLGHQDHTLRMVAIRHFKAKSPQDALNTLSPLLEGASDEIRQAIIEGFWYAEVDAFRVLQTSPESPRLRAALLNLLTPRDVKEGEPQLVGRLLEDSDHDVRVAALSLLSRKELPISEASLRKFLKDPSGEARQIALSSLTRMKVSDIETLISISCTDSDERVRETALSAGCDLNSLRLIEPMLKAVELGTEGDYVLCGLLVDPENLSVLERCAVSTNRNLRRLAALSINDEERAPVQVDLLIGMSSDKDPGVMRQVTWGLANAGTPGAIRALQQVAERSSGELLVMAIEAFALTKQPSLIGYLETYSTATDSQVRRAAKGAIRQLKRVAVPPTF